MQPNSSDMRYNSPGRAMYSVARKFDTFHTEKAIRMNPVGILGKPGGRCRVSERAPNKKPYLTGQLCRNSVHLLFLLSQKPVVHMHFYH